MTALEAVVVAVTATKTEVMVILELAPWTLQEEQAQPYLLMRSPRSQGK
jgi:hypothetical protein